jgi:hypothetical protein
VWLGLVNSYIFFMMKSKLFWFFLISGLLTACPGDPIEHDMFLKIINNSEQDIVWLFVFGKNFNQIDTYYWGDKDKTDDDLILSGKEDIYGFYSGNMTFNLKKYKSISFYLLNYDSVMTVPWNRIRDERIFLKEITFNTWEDFEACDFKIVYP